MPYTIPMKSICWAHESRLLCSRMPPLILAELHYLQPWPRCKGVHWVVQCCINACHGRKHSKESIGFQFCSVLRATWYNLLTYVHFPLKLTSNWLLNKLKIVNASRSSSRLGCREWLGSDLWVVLDLDSRINNSLDLSSSTNRVSNEAIESIFEPSSPILFYISRRTSLKYTCIFCLFNIVTRLLGL